MNRLRNDDEVIVWGTGKAMREFLYVDDMAAACIYVMKLNKIIYQQQTKPMLSHINVGTNQELTIKQLAEIIAKITNFKGKIEFDTTKPDGPKRKLMDSSRLNSLGWKSKIDLGQGIKESYKDYCTNSKQ